CWTLDGRPRLDTSRPDRAWEDSAASTACWGHRRKGHRTTRHRKGGSTRLCRGGLLASTKSRSGRPSSLTSTCRMQRGATRGCRSRTAVPSTQCGTPPEACRGVEKIRAGARGESDYVDDTRLARRESMSAYTKSAATTAPDVTSTIHTGAGGAS